MKAEDALKVTHGSRDAAVEKQKDLQQRLILHHASQGRYACPMLGAMYPAAYKHFLDLGYVAVGRYFTWDRKVVDEMAILHPNNFTT